MRTEKPWGQETLWSKTPQYAAKIIHIKAGHRLSLQYHQRKAESIHILSGDMMFHWEEKGGKFSRLMLSGDSREIPAGLIHRFAATECDVTLVEVSTPDLDDIVRLEDDYGRTA